MELLQIIKNKICLATYLIGLLNSSCSAQTQYWGESTYNLEKIEFSFDVAKFYSKGQNVSELSIEELNDSKRLYERKELICSATEDTLSIRLFDYSSYKKSSRDVMAWFGDFTFPYICMLADTEYRMVGVAVFVNFN